MLYAALPRALVVRPSRMHGQTTLPHRKLFVWDRHLAPFADR